MERQRWRGGYSDAHKTGESVDIKESRRWEHTMAEFKVWMLLVTVLSCETTVGTVFVIYVFV
jgi:hypothetical protein